MPLRILNDTGSGSSSNSAAALARAGDLGLKVVNASYGSTGYSNAEETAIRTHPNTLYVAAAGNANKNVDTAPLYPCAYADANIVCVGASDQNDDQAVFTRRPRIGAMGPRPSTSLRPASTSRRRARRSAYVFASGTSMSAPMVAAAAAMLFAYNPQLTALQAKQALMSSVDLSDGMDGLSVSGGRLNAAAALRSVGALDPRAGGRARGAAPVDDAPTMPDDADDPTSPTSSTTARGDAADGASGRLTLSAVSLDGPVRLCAKKCRRQARLLRFKLSARAPVVVSLARRTCPHGQKCSLPLGREAHGQGPRRRPEADGRADRRRHEAAHRPLAAHARRRAQPAFGALHRSPRPLTGAARARRQAPARAPSPAAASAFSHDPKAAVSVLRVGHSG